MAKAAQTPSRQLPTQSSDYAITITDCNSIAKAQISLRRESLNIKYGPNGIGKSTIARALVLNAQGGGALRDLLPFKYRQGDSGKAPAVVGADEIKKVLVFDEHYVSQFVFQPDEVVKNSLANYAFEHYEMAAYKSLLALAEAVGHGAAASALTQSLREEEAMAQWIDEHLKPTTLRFLQRSIAGEKAGV